MKPSGFRRLFRLPLSERTVTSQVADEVAFHIESRVESLVSSGVEREVARAQALREFGDVIDAHSELSRIDLERVRSDRRAGLMDAMRQDFRLVFRTMRREPWFALAVIVTLGLGIGVNAAMFGITDRLLFRAPAGIAQPDQVKRIFFSQTTPSSGYTHVRKTSWPDYEALRRDVGAFSSVAAYFDTDVSMGRGGEARKIRWSIASASLFPTLGVRPLVGRFYTEEEDTPGKPAYVAVLGHAFWKSAFGGDRAVIGRQLEIGRRRYTVIGVAPSGFNGVDYQAVDMFVPLSAAGPDAVGEEEWKTNAVGWIQLVVRMRPDASVEQARAEATATVKRLEPRLASDPTMAVTAESIILANAPSVSGTAVAGTAQISLWLSALSLLVLAIACANVINLLLVRVSRRQREIGIRMALGVSRGRLVSYLLLETLTLAGAGGVAGLAMAQWGGTLMRRTLLPEMDWSRGAIDGRVLLYTVTLVGACALLAAAAPAFQSLRTTLSSVLKSGAREGTHRSAMRHALIAVQTVLSVVLLVVAGLFVRSQVNLQRLDKGFDADHVMALNIELDVLDVSGPAAQELYLEAASRLRRIPGVADAAVGMTVPFWSSMWVTMKAEGVDSIPQIKDAGPFFNVVSPEYFGTVGTRILRGRAFTQNDGESAPKVVVISSATARLLWRGRDPIGKCIYFSRETECRRIVGVAQDAMHQTIEGDVMMLYFPLSQMRPSSWRAVFVRATGDPIVLQPAIRRTLLSVRRDMPYADIRVLSELMSPQTRQWELGAVLFSAFGLLALLLAGLGLYSVIAYNVAQRTRELSVRMALGARARHLVETVIGGVSKVVIAGLTCGLIIAMFASQRVASLLFHVKPWDRGVFLTVLLVLLIVGVAAGAVPAIRALRLQPNIALKEE